VKIFGRGGKEIRARCFGLGNELAAAQVEWRVSWIYKSGAHNASYKFEGLARSLHLPSWTTAASRVAGTTLPRIRQVGEEPALLLMQKRI
jgi:hypothetical protein